METVTLNRLTDTPKAKLPRIAYDLGEITQMGPYHLQTLRMMIQSGTLRASKVGKRWIVPAAEVARLLGEDARNTAP